MGRSETDQRAVAYDRKKFVVEAVRAAGIGQSPVAYAAAALRALRALPVEQRMEAMGMVEHTSSHKGMIRCWTAEEWAANGR